MKKAPLWGVVKQLWGIVLYNPSVVLTNDSSPYTGEAKINSPPCVKGDVSEADRGIVSLYYNPSVTALPCYLPFLGRLFLYKNLTFLCVKIHKIM